MSQLISTAQFLLGIIPHIISIAEAIETPGNGTDKAATVVQLVVAAVQSLPESLASKLHLQSIEAFANKVLTIVVAFFNKVGLFQHTTTAASNSTASGT
ncbi:MAG TPA: hypothetical protein VI756_20595 [Blastocatellia bacterium]